MTHGPTPEDVLAAFTRVLSRIYQRDRTTLSPEMRLEDIPMIDSLGLMQAVALLEEEFKVELDVAALDGMVGVQDVLNVVAGARTAAGSAA